LQKWTITRLIAWAIEFFKTKEIEEPRLSAELLLSSVLGLSRMQLYLNHDYVLDEAELKRYKELILKRLEQMPIQYILRESYFRKTKLYVDEHVLIPRNETELLVEQASEHIRKKRSMSSLQTLHTSENRIICLFPDKCMPMSQKTRSWQAQKALRSMSAS
jgi:HemK-like putative methylase